MKSKRTRKTENSIDTAYKAVLYPNTQQKVLIAKTLGCCRYVYNYFLNERITVYKESGRSVSFSEQQNRLPAMKKSEDTKWLSEVDSTALQGSLRNLQNAFDNFFAGLRENRHIGFPKFKSKHNEIESYRTVNNNNSIRVTDNTHIIIPKLGTVKCLFPMEVSGVIKHATVTREKDGHYSVSIMCETVITDTLPSTGAAVGIDLGIHSLAVTSDGKEYDNQKSYKNNQKKLRRLQRSLSRKTKGSNNRSKQKRKVAKLHRHIRNQRHDSIHKMTHEIVKQYDIICIENLNVAGMKKNRKLAREISDASFGEIRRQLDYKAKRNGKQLVIVDRWYPSSQTCSSCGYKNTDVKDLSVRKWICPVCGQEHDRDLNAAKNILAEGLKQVS